MVDSVVFLGPAIVFGGIILIAIFLWILHNRIWNFYREIMTARRANREEYERRQGELGYEMKLDGKTALSPQGSVCVKCKTSTADSGIDNCALESETANNNTDKEVKGSSKGRIEVNNDKNGLVHNQNG